MQGQANKCSINALLVYIVQITCTSASTARWIYCTWIYGFMYVWMYGFIIHDSTCWLQSAQAAPPTYVPCFVQQRH